MKSPFLRSLGLCLFAFSASVAPADEHHVYNGENLQAAVDAAAAWSTVWVGPGVYSLGGRPIFGSTLTNRVAVDRPLILRSLSGPESTVIVGERDGGNNFRCVYLASHAMLIGFTLTNGGTKSVANPIELGRGGGVFCESTNAYIENCIFAGNWAHVGGGVHSGTVSNCFFTNNVANSGAGAAVNSRLYNSLLVSNYTVMSSGGAARATYLEGCVLVGNHSGSSGGGTDDCTLRDCMLLGNMATRGGFTGGGGAYRGSLINCVVASNAAGLEGGGVYSAQVTNSLIYSNFCYNYGGGVSGGTLYNCTIANNRALVHSGGALYPCTLHNCIVYDNLANLLHSNYGSSCTLNGCCTTPLPSIGSANITSPPLFVNPAAGDYRLQPGSPCINSGRNNLVVNTNDLDGLRRISRSRVDIGAYEFQNPSTSLSYAWAFQYSVPTDGSADLADPDGDSFNNYQEALCGTDPTNALSALRMVSASTSGTNVTVTWQSVPGVPYTVQRATNLDPAAGFQTIIGTWVGQNGGSSSYIHTNGAAAGLNFYRINVQ